MYNEISLLLDEIAEKDNRIMELSQEAMAKTKHQSELEELLRSACAIAERKGEGTHWERFLNSAAALGINGITARTYRVLPTDTP